MVEFDPGVTIRYTKYARIDPETWAILKNEATKRTLETKIPCNVGWVVRQLVRQYITKL